MHIKLPYLGRSIEMKTISQGEYLYRMQRNDIVFSTGAAGTGKTFLSVAFAVNLLAEGKAERIIITRPVVEAGESLGYLPGDFKEKISPYMRPIYDSLYGILSNDMISKYMEEGKIESAPLAYMRGRTLNRSFIILRLVKNYKAVVKSPSPHISQGSHLYISALLIALESFGSHHIKKSVVKRS